jgi:hypothetical protein
MGLLPKAKRVYAQTYKQDEVEEIKKRIFIENRDRKIISIINDCEYVEQKLEDDPEFKKITHIEVKPLPKPSLNLLYIDFTYKN